ncbi:MAG TPA: deoxyguanosinetriphosphate triphosphohydrolase [Gemmataceae bacterium]|jgi:dGTPase|nr:deoxyguanosinetriphosphate triphosphohydrolase [Gemmataceae bacterium]
MTSPSPFEPPDWLDREDAVLAPYAVHTRASRGRRYPEAQHPYRTLFQRDRERIVHCTAFRRLMHKTQVIVAQTNDHHRTRLTHTLEVAQVSRTIARRLALNEDLTEAIALSHDLGHPPFGHAGENTLDECLRDIGGFDHNLHALRTVELLEERYNDFPGLNLSWEVREAFVHHAKNQSAPEIQPYLESGRPSLEAQVVDAADSLTYDTHDVDDAIGLGLISLEELAGVEFWRQAAAEAVQPGMALELVRHSVVRYLIDWQVRDLVGHTLEWLKKERIYSVPDVRQAPGPLVRCSPELEPLKAELEYFLHKRVYEHYRVLRMKQKGRRILQGLFSEFRRQPELLPERFTRRRQDDPVERVVGDYLAGMTDRYAQQEYLRLFHPTVDV